jgi:hypothetical protein
MIRLLIPLFSFAALAMTGCSGGSSSEAPPSAKVVENLERKTIAVELPKLAVDPATLDVYASRSLNVALNEPAAVKNGNVEIWLPKLEAGERDVVSIRNDAGNPVLMSIRGATDQGVVLNLESTAVAFVLADARMAAFGGNDVVLSDVVAKIKAHANFPLLSKELRESLAFESTCPINYECNRGASLLASNILDSIDFTQYRN